MTPWAPSFDGAAESNIEKYSIAQVQPPYPVAAQRYRIQGVVTVQVAVNKYGKVQKAEFVRGHTVFKTVSLEAAKQWQFESPNGTDIEGTIDFTFKLK
jgi:TonB family protein